MSSAPSSFTTASVPEGQPLGNPPAPRLPSDVVLQVLQLLPQKDLRAAAGASRDFNVHAHEAGLYIHRTVGFGAYFGDTLDMLDQVLEHAAANRPALNISIRLIFEPSYYIEPEVWHDGLRVFGATLQRALPNLVRLSFKFADMSPGDILATHRLYEGPAPKLRNLTVCIDFDCPEPFPAVIFDDNAPLLRKVVLDLRKIKSMSAWKPIATFRSVTHLRLEVFNLAHPLSLAPLFPGLRVLALWGQERQAIDIRGLKLSYYTTFRRDPTITDASLEALADIRVIKLRFPLYDPAKGSPEPVWHPRCDALCGVVQRDGCLSISFGPQDGTWQRTLETPYLNDGLCLPLADLPSMAATLSSLSIHDTLFGPLARAPVALASLRELFVDMERHPEPFWWQLEDCYSQEYAIPAIPRVACPVLERVVLYALPAAADPVTLLPERVAQMGVALGSRGRRPTLTLAGCILDPSSEAPESTDIPQLFAEVRSVEYSGAFMPVYYEAYRRSHHSLWRYDEWDPPNA